MRRSGRLLVAMLGLAPGACSFSASVGGLGPDEMIVTIVADTAEELGTGKVTDGVIAATGRIEPDAFVLGGLHARAFTGDLVADNDSYETAVAKTATLTSLGAGYRQVPTDWAAERPRGLGLTSGANFTLLYGGEILLPMGTIRLEIDASERAIVQVALDRANPAAFSDKLFARNEVASIELVVPEPGWYPIRTAYSEGGGDANLVMTIVEGPARTTVGADRLRARVTAAPGLVVFAFGGPGFIGELGETARPTVDDAFGAGAPPFDLGQPIDRFSLRYAGQLRIDTAGAYTFTGNVGIDTNDGFRLWIDREPRAYRWTSMPLTPSVTVDLEPGWHDFLLDHADEIGNAQIAITMMGPDAPAGGPIDPARLRPAVRFGNTFTYFETVAKALPDLAQTLVPLPLPGDTRTVIDALDYGLRIENQQMSSLVAELVDCNGTKPLTLATTPGYFYFPADLACRGKPTKPAFPYQFRLTDTIAGNTGFAGNGQTRDYGISALYHGGDRFPFATVVRYESAVLPTPGALRIEALRAIGALDGAVLELAVRTGADAASVAAAPWTVIAPERTDEIAASEFAQYRVVMITDGWQYPTLDKLEIDYVVPQ